MKSLILSLFLFSLWNYPKANIAGADTIQVKFGNNEIHCFGNIIVDATGTISLQLKIRNQSAKTIILIEPSQIYLYVHQINDSYTVLEFMLGGQHLCPYQVYSYLTELHLKIVPAGDVVQIDNQYRIPPEPLKCAIRYDFIVTFQEFERLLKGQAGFCVENLRITTEGDRFFISPHVITKDNIKKSEWGGGALTIDLFSPIPKQNKSTQ